MRRLIASLATGAVLALLSAVPAQAEFGFTEFDVNFTGPPPVGSEPGTLGPTVTQAGSHPFAMTTTLHFISTPTGEGGETAEEAAKDILIAQMPGFIGNPTAVPRCSAQDFLTSVIVEVESEPGFKGPAPVAGCPVAAAVGVASANLSSKIGSHPLYGAIYNLEPPPGAAAKLGFWIAGTPVTLELGVSESAPHNIFGGPTNIPQVLEVIGSTFTIWGVPADPAHDPERGLCQNPIGGESLGDCTANVSPAPFLTLPRSCEGPLRTNYMIDSWQNPLNFVKGFAETHDSDGSPLGFTGCGKLGFSPEIESNATAKSAESGTGLDFALDFKDEGLTNPTGIAGSDTEKAVVTLPQGVTINPSVGEGLGVCTPAQLAQETAKSLPGQGCPDASKIGALHLVTPLIDEAIDGSIYLAQQDDPATTAPGTENPFDSLIALYFVLQNPNLGVSVKLPVKVEADPKTGQLTATVDDAPQIPFARFEAHLRTGARAPLVTPGACGTYVTTAELTPRANPAQSVSATSSFQISSGVGGGPCPSGGVPPFHPRFEAGAINNNAGSFSPFNMRLIRSDGEQDMTKFSSVLPPGELGSLAGVGKCSDAAISAAKAKTGRQELASPSCPANSLIGHTLAGAGVGDSLTYVGGQLYLGGPYRGDPLSVISITPAVAGPFDAGTVVVRLALTLNPKTAEVEVDGANSDPIPHILKGIVLKVRDLRVYVDRPNFTLNPTSCDELSARGTLFGSYLDVFSPADDVPVALRSRYQAANCLNLDFKPKLDLRLKGGTKRGGHPALTATYTPRKGDANLEGLVVRLPRSAFLDQAHIRTICTRVQFAAKACPAGAQYGFIKAWTPLLDEPLEGPVYLRSSNHNLPDLVFDLHGLVDVEVATRIDSSHGGIRATVEHAPDAPLSKVVLNMQGAKKGLIVNSRNLCGAVSKANVEFSGQNGREFDSKPVMRADCGGKRKHRRANR